VKPFSVNAPALIPAPSVVDPGGAGFVVGEDLSVGYTAGDGEVARIAALVGGWMGAPAGFGVPAAALPSTAAVRVELDPEAGSGEAYRLDIDETGVRLAAATTEGLFRGAQTLRQLLPLRAERGWSLPAVSIRDFPRYAWRGAMLDVSRHFFGVADVKRFLDELAYYKLNVLHLHLSDDQGWRIEIASRPRLAEIGGVSQVGGGAGGCFTAADYAELHRYAAERYITLVPEIDLPGHTNAALVAYPELAPAGYDPVPFSGTDVGFSVLDVANPATYDFVNDVVGELARMTPGRHLHIGGDEVHKLGLDEYAGFIRRAIAIVEAHGKVPIGWDEIAKAGAPTSAVVQFWRTHEGEAHIEPVRDAANRGAKVIMSPGSRAYLDMKYDASTRLGLDWAGLISVRDAYDWDPDELLGEVPEGAVLGVEAPIWTETLETIGDVEYLAFPRLTGIAEVAWSPAGSRDWDAYQSRLTSHIARWDALGIAHGPAA
jgi:hexosaminidase